MLACLALLATTEQHTVGHDCGHFAVRLEHRKHVLDEHEVGLFAFFRQPDGEAAGVVDVLADVILRKRRIGQHPVEALEFAALRLVLRLAQSVLLADVGVRDAVQQHVHLADRPGGADGFLAEKREVTRIAATFADVVAGLNQHAAGSTGGVVNRHAGLGIYDLNQAADDIGRGVELAGLFAGRIGEEFDQVFVGGTEQVGKLEVFVAQWDFLKILDEIRENGVVERALSDFAVEVDVLEHVLQGIDVGVFERFERLVQTGADVGLEVADFFPASLFGDKKGEFVRVLELGLNHIRGHAAGAELFRQRR